MSHRPVAAEHLQVLIGQARRAGALLLPVTDPAMRTGLAAALDDAARRQEPSAGYTTELELWTRRYAGARDGVPRASIAPAPVGAVHASPLRRFPHGQLAQPRQLPGHGTADDAAELLVIAMPGDERPRPAEGRGGDERRAAGRHPARAGHHAAEPGHRGRRHAPGDRT